jgi:hypothetical protein
MSGRDVERTRPEAAAAAIETATAAAPTSPHGSSGMSRRGVLQAMIATGLVPAAAAAAAAPRATATAGTDSAAAARQARFDERDPAANLRALVKFEGSLDGRPGFTYTAGTMVRTRYGELAQPLLGYARCQVRVFRAMADGRYACAKHNWMMSTDLRTGEFVKEYRDPVTGALLPAPSFVVRNTPMVYGPDGIRWTKIRTFPELVAAPLLMQWHTVGEEGWATLGHTLRTAQVGDRLGVETASTTKRFRWADLLADAPHADCSVSDLLQVDEPPASPDAPRSQLLWVGAGRRMGRADELPEAFVRETENRFPGMLGDVPVPTSR